MVLCDTHLSKYTHSKKKSQQLFLFDRNWPTTSGAPVCKKNISDCDIRENATLSHPLLHSFIAVILIPCALMYVRRTLARLSMTSINVSMPCRPPWLSQYLWSRKSDWRSFTLSFELFSTDTACSGSLEMWEGRNADLASYLQ